MNPELEKVLQKYLEDCEAEKQRGHTMANVILEVRHLSSGLEELRTEQKLLRLRVDRHGRDLREVKRLVKYDGEADSGIHDLEELKAGIEDARKQKLDSLVWHRRKTMEWVVGGVGAVVTLILSAVVAYLVGRTK